jgi:hypothetical protein
MRPHDKFAILLFFLLFLALGLCAIQVQAHPAPSGWEYDPDCCGGHATTGDCYPVPDAAIRETQGGYSILIRPGEHRKVPATAMAALERILRHGDPRIRPSGDGRKHACIGPAEALYCIYVPPGGV